MVKEGGAWKSDHVGRRAHAPRRPVSRGANGQAARSSSTSTRAAASRASSTRWLAAYGMPAHLSVDFEADAATIEANRRTYGVAWPSLSFKDAKLIVSFGADFLDGWGASVPQQLDFADARAKLDGAPRFVYIGAAPLAHRTERRRMDRVQAGQRAGDRQRARRQGEHCSRRRPTAASDGRDCSGLPTELAAAKPALVLSGVSGDNALDVALAVAAINQAVGRGRHDDQASAADHSVRRNGARRTRCSPPSSGCARRPGRHRVRARHESRATRCPRRPSSPRRSQSRHSRCQLLVASPTRRPSCATSIIPDLHSLESWGDAEPTRGVIGLQQPAMDPVYPTSIRRRRRRSIGTGDVLLQVAKKDPANAAKFTAADYRTWLIVELPGWRARLSPPRCRRRSRAATLPARTIAAAPSSRCQGSADRRARRATSSSSPIRRRCSATGAARTSRGCRSCPIRSRKICWSSWVELHPETAQRLGIERGDILEVKTANGTVRAPAFPYLGIHKDAIAIPLGQGHKATAQIATFDPTAPFVGDRPVGLRPLRARPRHQRARSAPGRNGRRRWSGV